MLFAASKLESPIVLTTFWKAFVSRIVGSVAWRIVASERDFELNFIQIGGRCVVFHDENFGIHVPRSLRRACFFSGGENGFFAHSAVAAHDASIGLERRLGRRRFFDHAVLSDSDGGRKAENEEKRAENFEQFHVIKINFYCF